jgi:hypothetical protein
MSIDAELFRLIRKVSIISLLGNEVTHHLGRQDDASSSVIVLFSALHQ